MAAELHSSLQYLTKVESGAPFTPDFFEEFRAIAGNCPRAEVLIQHFAELTKSPWWYGERPSPVPKVGLLEAFASATRLGVTLHLRVPTKGHVVADRKMERHSFLFFYPGTVESNLRNGLNWTQTTPGILVTDSWSRHRDQQLDQGRTTLRFMPNVLLQPTEEAPDLEGTRWTNEAISDAAERLLAVQKDLAQD